MDNKNSSTRNIYIDKLKVLAIIFVIITHDPWSVDNSKKNVIFPFLIDMAVPMFMIISGYNYSVSCIKKKKGTIKDLYCILDLWHKVLRFLIPFSLVIIGEVLLLIIFKNQIYSIEEVTRVLFRGGYGPGSYYTPIMMQFIIISPLLFFVVKRWRKNGILIIFCFNLLYEWVYTACALPGAVYPFFILRYLFIITLGIAWAMKYDKQINIPHLILCWGLGLFYLLYTQYITKPICFTRWTTTSMMAGIYIFPVILCLEKVNERIEKSYKTHKLIILCSKSTYHIYLFQMVYYFIGIERFFYGLPIYLRLIGNVAICIFAGCVYYLLLEYIQGRKVYLK